MYQLTKSMVDFRRNQFLNQGLQTEFTIQQECKNKLISVGTQLKNLNNIEKIKYVKPDSSYDESSGESSVCETNRPRRLSVLEVTQMVIDTEEEEAIKLEPKPFQKNNRVEPEWENQKTIIVINVDEQCISDIDMEEFFDEQYSILLVADKPFIQFKSLRFAAYAGKLAVVVRMRDDKAAQYVYYNLVTSSYKYRRALGDTIEFAQLKSIDKNSPCEEITVCLRFFPSGFTKERLDMIKNARIEELFLFQGFRYGIFKVLNYEDAEANKKAINNYFFLQKKQCEAQITIMVKKQIDKEKYKFFLEDNSQNSRLLLEQKIGIQLTPQKIPQLLIKEIEQPKINVPVIQPTICAIQIPTIKQIDLKPVMLEEQKVVAKPVQLKPVKIEPDRHDRQRSSRKRQ